MINTRSAKFRFAFVQTINRCESFQLKTNFRIRMPITKEKKKSNQIQREQLTKTIIKEELTNVMRLILRLQQKTLTSIKRFRQNSGNH